MARPTFSSSVRVAFCATRRERRARCRQAEQVAFVRERVKARGKEAARVNGAPRGLGRRGGN
eukprot:11221747-Lingulodinium_polyedra.AAC.1